MEERTEQTAGTGSIDHTAGSNADREGRIHFLSDQRQTDRDDRRQQRPYRTAHGTVTCDSAVAVTVGTQLAVNSAFTFTGLTLGAAVFVLTGRAVHQTGAVTVLTFDRTQRSAG